jgi:CelD/BcsL family acetyltransferase involved in cellulose biosynthesis
MRSLDCVEAARRLARLRDASGKPILAYQAMDFRARWKSRRFIDKLTNWRRRRDMREERRRAGWGGPPEYLTPPWEGDAKEANNE